MSNDSPSSFLLLLYSGVNSRKRVIVSKWYIDREKENAANTYKFDGVRVYGAIKAATLLPTPGRINNLERKWVQGILQPE